MELYNEEDFYKDNGWPTEEYFYCSYYLPVDYETVTDGDYDQFILVVNAIYPYLRLSRKRGGSQFPCGHSSSPSTSGLFASKTDNERDETCPKIAWGLVAWYFAYLSFSYKQQDYMLKKDQVTIFSEYYKRLWDIYNSNHSGLKYSKISVEQKELDFISGHIDIERKLWEASTPLKAYSILFNYAKDARDEYERFLVQKMKDLENSMAIKNTCFSTKIGQTFDTEYVKVFFLDDSVAPEAQKIVWSINSVRNVNITVSQSAAHPGNTLTVYPKPMVTAQACEKDVIEVLRQFFKGTSKKSRSVKTDAYFEGIEKQVINDIDKARVSIHVAMAWFTNQRIADKLIEKYEEGLDVKVVSFDDHTNAKFGVFLGEIPHHMVKSSKGGIMHNKFCVIDNQKVLTGSYNWSDKAENKNVENVSVLYDDERASDYSIEFRKLFESKD